jgi:hypothetical protein
MICQIEGCSREAVRDSKTICEMHYYRRRRGGTFERRANYEGKANHSAGYVLVKDKAHPLAHETGYIYEHRKVAYQKYGDALPGCELCGCQISWANCHIDHIDNDKQNNSPDNLRPTCCKCNTGRIPQRQGVDSPVAIPIIWNGESKTAVQWANDPRVPVSATAIARRLKKGYPIDVALTAAPRRLPSKRDSGVTGRIEFAGYI